MNTRATLLAANQLQRILRTEGLIEDSLICIEAGARKPATDEASRERFYALEGARVVAFEADTEEADRLVERLSLSSGIEIVGAALGERDGMATLFVTENPSCSSLFEPNEQVIGRFPGLHVARLSHTTQVEVVTLDRVCADKGIRSVDFVKMDVQGGELGILRGGSRSLSEVAAVVTEVSFQKIYNGQPLFGEISEEMSRQGMEFYGFVHTGGKSRGSRNRPTTQALWGDALFLRTPEASPPGLAAKVSVFAALYGALDFAEASLRSIGSAPTSKLADGLIPRASASAEISKFARRVRKGIVRRLSALQQKAH